MPGTIAVNFHEGSRAEYLAQYLFSGFGTSIPVPHQEDSGIDFYCTMTEKLGRLAWPRAYFTVQVKSTDAPWELNGREFFAGEFSLGDISFIPPLANLERAGFPIPDDFPNLKAWWSRMKGRKSFSASAAD